MIRQILVPLDGSALAESALPYVQALARLTGASITLTQVVEPLETLGEFVSAWEVSTVYADQQAAAERAADAYLSEVARRLDAAGVSAQVRVEVGWPAEAIIRTAQAFDLVAMATHGRGGLGRWVFGSVTDKVLRGAMVPILLIRATPEAPAAVDLPRRILVPLDSSSLAEQALPMAALLAQRAGATLILLQSIGWAQAAAADYPLFFAAGLGAERLLEQAEESAHVYLTQVSQRLSAQGLTVRTEIRREQAAEAILDGAAEAQADLIVMSTHGRGGLRRWVYGAVTDRVLRGATLPVLLVRADSADGADAAATTPEAARDATTAARPTEAQ